MTTAKKLRNAEARLDKAQEVLDKTRQGLHAAEEVVETTEKAGRHPVLITLGILLLFGVIWMVVQAAKE